MNFNTNVGQLIQDANTAVNTTVLTAVVLPRQWRELKRKRSTEAAKVRIKKYTIFLRYGGSIK
jgi:hypothetical protein